MFFSLVLNSAAERPRLESEGGKVGQRTGVVSMAEVSRCLARRRPCSSGARPGTGAGRCTCRGWPWKLLASEPIWGL